MFCKDCIYSNLSLCIDIPVTSSGIGKLQMWSVGGALQNTCSLTLTWRRSQSCRNHSTDLLLKSMAWFLYHRDLHYERVKLWETFANYISLSFHKIVQCRPRIGILPNSFVEWLFSRAVLSGGSWIFKLGFANLNSCYLSGLVNLKSLVKKDWLNCSKQLQIIFLHLLVKLQNVSGEPVYCKTFF